jgi:MSHA biogenesis protein MshL
VTVAPTIARRRDTSPLAGVAAGFALLLLISGCANRGFTLDSEAAARTPMEQATTSSTAKPPVVVPAHISDALQGREVPMVEAPAEPRFDLVVNSAQAREVFLAMVTDTRYSMLMHPEVAGTLSVTLRGVTVREALEAIRDVYGYDFKIDGRRITVFPPTLQTRIFTVNYLNLKREGRSEIRVNSGATAVPGSGTGATPAQPTTSGITTPTQQAFENSRLSTTSRTEFWGELEQALRGIVGAGPGRTVVVSPQSGVVAVRAMPEELRQVEAFLKATRIAVERQVMLEAKIVEVQLRDGFQSGVDWSVLRGRGAGGQISGSPANQLLNPPVGTQPPASPTGNTLLPVLNAAPSLVDAVNFPPLGSGLFGLVFGTKSFEGVLAFLETQGSTQILSSPRLAALNNQRAVIKVGTDEMFVTGVTGGTITTGLTAVGNTTTLPTITFASYFSGIALDVMPQIDESDTITLHIHPSLSSVSEAVKQIDLGGSIGKVQLPLPVSSSNETDTVIRVTDGQMVAIGGLMQLVSQMSRSGIPGSAGIPLFSSLAGNQQTSGTKREIVVLIRPTIIRSIEDWREQAREVKARIDDLNQMRRTISIDGSVPDTTAKPK